MCEYELQFNVFYFILRYKEKLKFINIFTYNEVF